MKYSVVNYGEVSQNDEFRIEAEFYSPEFIKLKDFLNKKNAKQFGDYVDEIRCGPFGSTILCETYDQKGVIVARPFNIKNCTLENNNLAYITEEDCINKELKLYNYKDIFFSRVGDVRCGLVPEFQNKITISPNIIAVKTNSEKLNPFYAAIFFNTKYGFKQLLRNIKVVAQPTIPTEIIQKLKIVILEERFQDLIEKLFRQYFNNCERFDNLYYDSKNIFLESFGVINWKPKYKLSYIKNFSDINSVNRFDAEYFQPKYDEITEKIKSCPYGWDKLSNIITPKKGIEVGSEEYCEKGIPFVRVSNLSQHEINNNNMQYMSEKYYNSIADIYQPKKGEILLSKDGTPGIAHYLNETPPKMIPSGGILRLSLHNNEYLPEYLTLVLNSTIVQMQVERVSSGALIKHWLVDEIQNTLIPKLEMDKQIEIVEQLNKAAKLRKQSKQLLEIAKRGVEIAIEENEDIAINWIDEQLLKIGVEL